MRTCIVVFVAIYLLGSVNFSILLLRLFRKGDPRKWSSGNPGVFNVYRQYGFLWATPVFLLDIGRAAGAAALASWYLSPELVPWGSLALVLGNRYPVFHFFRGGKGVASYLGFTAVVSPFFAVAAAMVWVVVYRISRQAFIGSFGMVAVLAVGMTVRSGWTVTSLSATILAVGIIVLGHRRNIGEQFRR